MSRVPLTARGVSGAGSICAVGQYLQAQVGWWDHLDLETP